MKLPKKYKWIGAAFALGASALPATDRSDEQIVNADFKELVEEMTPLSGTNPAHWRVVWSGDTSTSATISWSTAENGKKHVVHYGTKNVGSDTEKYEFHAEAPKNGPYSITEKEAKDTKTAFFHHCPLTGLTPGTNYYFVLESDGKFSKPLYFKTAPKSGDFKLLTGGDSRSGIASRCLMNLRMAKEFSEKPEILALVHGGDYIVSGRSWRQWRSWLSNHELTTLSDGRVLPVIPTRGNHDGGPLFFEIFNLEKNRADLSFWHSIQVTDDVNIVTLDTNYSAKGAQEEWLEKQLSKLRPKSRWLLTNYHRPLYPAVKSPAGQTSVFVPLFEKYNVDLSLESDGHCIKRTVPIRDGKEDPTGIVYVGEGGLGVGQRTPKTDLWYLKGGYAGRGHHVMQLSFSKDALEVETIMLEGNTIDKVTLKPRSH